MNSSPDEIDFLEDGMDHEPVLPDAPRQGLILDRGLEDHGTSAQPFVGSAGQAAVHGITQPNQFLPGVLDGRVDGCERLGHRFLHALALGRDNG